MATRPGRYSVLIVDDEAQLRLTIADALTLEGYDVSTATNGADALALIPHVKPDVIVFDLWMPVLDGFEFRKALLATYPDVPVIVLSALDMRNPRLAELEATALLAKPFDLESLYAAIEGVLRRPNGTGERPADPSRA